MALIAGVLAVAVLASAPQGLADAARKAAHERKRNDDPGMTVTKLSVSPLDGDLDEPKLTLELFDRYALARAAVGRAFAHDRTLHDRVEARVARLKRGREAAGIYEMEPALKAAIEFHGFTVKTFMDVVLTIARANARAYLQSGDNSGRFAEPRPGVLPPIPTANTAFAREHFQMIRSVEERLALSNAWWLPAPRGVPY